MGMFNMASTAGLKESGSFLGAGIHTAKFKGITLGQITSQKDGVVYTTMNVAFDVNGFGDFSHNFFEPKSDQRTESQYGPNPSPAEHFMVGLRQIFDALSPKIGEMIDNDNVVIQGKKIAINDLDFTQLIKLSKVLTDPYIDTEVEIKLVPQNTGFNDFPGFPAKINRAGMLTIATRFIGHNLTLSQSEMKKIEAAKNSRPTNMSNSNTTLDGIAEDLGISDQAEDLPF